jgi:hypothetical protein
MSTLDLLEVFVVETAGWSRGRTVWDRATQTVRGGILALAIPLAGVLVHIRTGVRLEGSMAGVRAGVRTDVLASCKRAFNGPWERHKGLHSSVRRRTARVGRTPEVAIGPKDRERSAGKERGVHRGFIQWDGVLVHGAKGDGDSRRSKAHAGLGHTDEVVHNGGEIHADGSGDGVNVATEALEKVHHKIRI